MSSIFDNVFDSSVSSISVEDFLICIACSLVCGFIIALLYSRSARSSRGYVLSLALLPAIVSLVIIVVNGSIGMGVAVAGAFSLVRFRSAPGNAREIGIIFLAMACGLLVGAGYLVYALLVSVLVSALHLVYTRMDIMSGPSGVPKVLRMTVPKEIDYNTEFSEVFKEYTITSNLTSIRTADMGTMFRLTYDVLLYDENDIASFVSKIREKNDRMEVNIFNVEQSDWSL